MENIRTPKQLRAIAKKEKIIEAGFELICQNGYYNTNTAEIAKKAGVSTGIIYQYFEDKYDIFMNALQKYGDDIFFPMLKTDNINLKNENFEDTIKKMIQRYINNHKVSKIAHEEIMAMVHSDQKVADYYYKRELEMTAYIKELLLKNGNKDNYLTEKVHIIIGLIDNLCHEIIYHKHDKMDYNIMTNITITTISSIIKSNLKF